MSTLASGSYPALIVSGYSPQQVLKGTLSKTGLGSTIRKALILSQFGFLVFLMVCIYVVYEQLAYMQEKNLGMTTDQVLVLRTSDLDTAIDRGQAFQRWNVMTKSMGNIQGTCAAWVYPGEKKPRGHQIYRSLDETKQIKFLRPNLISAGFLGTMEMTVLAGRDFIEGQPDEHNKVIINETAALQLGFDDPSMCVGELLTFKKFSEREYEIIGVIKDFNTSVKFPVGGEIFYYQAWNRLTQFENFLVKISGEDISTSIRQIEKTWTELFPDTPFDYFFLDSYFETFYNEERQFAGVFGFFTIIAVIIACMGLFGLSSYSTRIRTKEIGIRKSLGASAGNIVWMFSRDYIRLVLAASALGIPAGIFLLSEWLKNYPDRIRLEWDAILIPVLLMICTAVLTVGFQTLKAAKLNPVESLRAD